MLGDGVHVTYLHDISSPSYPTTPHEREPIQMGLTKVMEPPTITLLYILVMTRATLHEFGALLVAHFLIPLIKGI